MFKLEEFKFPEVTEADAAFPTFKTIPELLKEAEKREEETGLLKGQKKFMELFYDGGTITLKEDVKGSWKENAWIYCRAFMGSWKPKHEHKMIICAMLMEECLQLEPIGMFKRIRNSFSKKKQ